MTLLWRDKWAVGNDLIDIDHRCLIGMMNTVELAMLTDPALVDGALEQLQHYTADHFAREERIQRAIGYAGLAAHRAAHDELRARIGDIRGHVALAIDHADGEALARLVQRLRQWLVDHIMHEDQALKPLLKDRPAAFAG